MPRPDKPLLRRAKPLLGTLVEVACAHEASEAACDGALEASNRAFDAIAVIHGLMSRHEASSDLSRFNLALVGQWVAVDARTVAVFRQAWRLSAQTGGIFDVCALNGNAPGNWRNIEIDVQRMALRKHAPLSADLGGIAKGYAVDAAVDALVQAGIRSGWVNAGGDLRVFGAIEIPVSVRDPHDLSRVIDCTRLSGRSAATSAGYLSRTNGSMPQLLHGVTRAPVVEAASWTVAAATCMLADALTKVVAATGNANHPVLAHYAAEAWIF